MTNQLRPEIGDWERTIGARLVERDESALGEVYDQYSSYVYGLAVRVIGDACAAEDVAQEVFSPCGSGPQRRAGFATL